MRGVAKTVFFFVLFFSFAFGFYVCRPVSVPVSNQKAWSDKRGVRALNLYEISHYKFSIMFPINF